MFNLLHSDILSFCERYQGEPFHALLCDPPYHLTTITKRFGKEGSAPAKFGEDGLFQRASKGFMNAEWDSDIAFRPETWAAIGQHLYPGAFGMAFGGSRTAHRMAVAIEDAGFIIHPMMGWIYGSGFPKATRVKGQEEFDGHRYGTQALKPALEPIIVFQKPYEGRPIDNIVESGAGALNIDRGRVGVDKNIDDMLRKTERGKRQSETWEKGSGFKNEKNELTGVRPEGRWPANFVITHSPDCKVVGYKEPEPYQINRFTDGAKPFGDGAGHEFETEEIEGGKIPVWECAEGCPAKDKEELRFFHQSSWAFENQDPFIYQAKASRTERNAGLQKLEEQEVAYSDYRGNFKDTQDFVTHYPDGSPRPVNKVRNPHPTLKPIALAAHLASLLLPPESYKPRRILIPFGGVASEMIGCFQAGWDEATGVELEEEYVEIGRKRLEHWLSQGVQLQLL